MAIQPRTTVCVTGGSGFVGSHCVHQLLAAGYAVRATVRSLAKADAVRSAVLPAGVDPARLSFHVADLDADAGWADALAGCAYVLHVASPFPLKEPKHEDDLIRPAVEGTRRVLGHALAAGVKRAVVTSSYAALGYGHDDYSRPHDETHWTEIDKLGAGREWAYVKSKTLAERAAWRFYAEHPELELTVINPSGVFGPLLPGIKDVGSSLGIIQMIMTGKMPIAPRVAFAIVDVRDVAALHVLAMTHPKAKGQRYMACADGTVSLQDMGRELGVAIRTMPDWTTRMLQYVVADLKPLAAMLGEPRRAANGKARDAFGYAFRKAGETLRASAEGLKEAGLLG